MKRIIRVMILSIVLLSISGQVYCEEDTDLYIRLNYGEEITDALLTGDIVNSEFEVYDENDKLVGKASTEEGEKQGSEILLRVAGAKIVEGNKYKIKLVKKGNEIRSYVIMFKTEVKENQWGVVELIKYTNGEETYLLGSKETPIEVRAVLEETSTRFIKLEDKEGVGVANQVLGIIIDSRKIERTTNKWGYIVVNAGEETIGINYSKSNYNSGKDVDLITLSENELTATVIEVEKKASSEVVNIEDTTNASTGTLVIATEVKGNVRVIDEWLNYNIKLTKQGKVIVEIKNIGEIGTLEELAVGTYGITVSSDNAQVNVAKSVTITKGKETKITTEVKPKNILRLYTVKNGKKIRNDYTVIGMKTVDYKGSSTRDYGVINGNLYTVKNNITDSVETIKITSGLNTIELQGELTSVDTSASESIKPTGVEERKTLAAIWDIIKIVTVIGFILFLGAIVTSKKENEVK